ncbi:uncharacterized protein LOC141706030 [Apium graveolens]|uniref:uncharacterized protein LOC141706030 n=1 Tax=Apium graveolens TaxID=4045 RepID=UPI003D798F09
MRKSNIQKGNRNSGVDGHPSTHTGGSRSHKTHAADLAKELKRKPHPREVFKRTHFKHGKWVDKKSELINEAIEEHLKQHSENVDESLESQPIDELEVYIDVVGEGPGKILCMVSVHRKLSFMGLEKVIAVGHVVRHNFRMEIIK